MITFIHRGGAQMASFRYRAAIPAKAIGAQVNTGEADVLVFAKPMQGDLEMAREAKGSARIVVDICDPHDYRDIVALADVVTCPCDAMAGVIKEHYGRDASVIPDPVEGPQNRPHADWGTFLWFGNPINIPTLQKWLPFFAGEKLTVVTTPNQQVHCIPWSLEAQWAALATNSIVLLPAEQAHKSENRLTEAINAGCFAICSSLPSYIPFRPWMWVGNPLDGKRFAKHFRNELNDRVREAQDYVTEKYSPDVIGKLWLSACT